MVVFKHLFSYIIEYLVPVFFPAFILCYSHRLYRISDEMNDVEIDITRKKCQRGDESVDGVTYGMKLIFS